MGNFDVISGEWILLKKLGKQAEENVYRDPNITLIKMRLFAEQITEAIFSIENMDNSYLRTQVDKLKKLERSSLIEGEIVSVFHNIRKIGNKAAHDNYGSKNDAMYILKQAHFLMNWFLEVYGPLDFKAKDFVVPEDAEAVKQQKIDELSSELEDFKHKLEEERKKNASRDVDTIDLERARRRKRSKAFLDGSSFDEKETRLMFIDKQLESAGWEVDSEILRWAKGARPEKGKNKAIAEVPTSIGPADYALFIGLQLVGIVEAKRYGKTVVGDLSQAKDYAKAIKDSEDYILIGEYGAYRLPFIYSSNGRPYLKQFKEYSGIWFFDARTPNKSSIALESWHSPDDLSQKLIVDIEKSEKDLEKEPFPDFAARDYQIAAVKAVEEGLKQNKTRMLISMATGTGKTRLALSLIYRLIKTKRFRRVLFLVDRRSLGIQMQDTLKDIKVENQALDDIYDVKKLKEAFPEDSTKIQVATVQSMIRRLFYNEGDEELSVGTYDFIIVDEAHRGYTGDKELSEEELLYENEQDYVSQYRRVIDYFDATVLGLTATPALHTTEIFGPPIFNYTFREAVVGGYLCDFNPPHRFETELSKYGIKFDSGEEVDCINPVQMSIDKAYLEDELDFEIEDFNKKVITENFNKVILEKLTDYITPNEDEGKTLIFAATDMHADMIVRLFKEAYYKAGIEVDEDAIEKITSKQSRADELIKKFKNEKYPNVVVTVDMLTTGIDVPRISNLVFLRKVRSRILYEQMLGRATRLCPEIGKEYFNIFDAVHLYDDLEAVTDMKPVVVSFRQTLISALDKAVHSLDGDEFLYYKDQLLAKIQRKMQRLSPKDKEKLELVIEGENLDKWIEKLIFIEKDELKDEIKNIENFDIYKPYRYSAVISNHEDRFMEDIIGYGEGNTKPSDYLDEFNTFIRENINKIPALNIIVSSPKDLKYKDLKEVELILRSKDFDEHSLQSAWKQEKKERVLADIISFIRQAALGEALIDHETRIKNAMTKIYGMRDWTKRQEKWLNRIEKQLLETPVLAPSAREYFDGTKIWIDNGGYKKAKAELGDDIDQIVDDINTYLYAS